MKTLKEALSMSEALFSRKNIDNKKWYKITDIFREGLQLLIFDGHGIYFLDCSALHSVILNLVKFESGNWKYFEFTANNKTTLINLVNNGKITNYYNILNYQDQDFEDIMITLSCYPINAGKSFSYDIVKDDIIKNLIDKKYKLEEINIVN